MYNTFKGCALALSLAIVATPTLAVTYTLDSSLSSIASGTIETDGTIGNLFSGSVIAWDIELISNNNSYFTLDETNSEVGFFNSGFLIGSATELSFDYDNGGHVLFQNPGIGSAINYFCFEDLFGGCSSQPNGSVATYNPGGGETSISFSGIQSFASTSPIAPVPLPASLPLLIASLGVLGIGRKLSAQKSAA